LLLRYINSVFRTITSKLVRTGSKVTSVRLQPGVPDKHIWHLSPSRKYTSSAYVVTFQGNGSKFDLRTRMRYICLLLRYINSVFRTITSKLVRTGSKVTSVRLQPGVPDKHIWRLSPSRKYTSSAYAVTFQGSVTFEPRERIWKAWAPPKCVFSCG
jgi:hypothetical protein